MASHLKMRLRITVKNIVLRVLDAFLVGYGFIFFHSLHGRIESSLHGYAAVLAGCLFLLIGNGLGLYNSKNKKARGSYINGVVITWATTLLALLLLAYVTKTSSAFSRFSVSLWIAVVPVVLWLLRKTIDLIYRSFSHQIGSSRIIAVAGGEENAARFIKSLNDSPELRMEVGGIYLSVTEDRRTVDAYSADLIKGNIEQLIQDVKQGLYDEVYIALSMSARSEITFLISSLSDCSAPVYFIPDIFTLNIMSSQVYNLNGIPLVSVYDTPMDRVDVFIKRMEDVVISIVILLIVAVPMLLIALVIKLTSEGSVIFRQKRYGLGGEPIEVWKFRSMNVSEDGSVVIQATSNDPRVTPVGAFLRRTSLDELPQFFNVIKGDMSIVGPRPHSVAHNELYRKAIQGYMLRHLVKPGITGWAQINGWRGETETLDKMEKRVQYDLEYIKNWSLWFDLKIIALTILDGFTGKNAY